jgi:hypothetical protein
MPKPPPPDRLLAAAIAVAIGAAIMWAVLLWFTLAQP